MSGVEENNNATAATNGPPRESPQDSPPSIDGSTESSVASTVSSPDISSSSRRDIFHIRRSSALPWLDTRPFKKEYIVVDGVRVPSGYGTTYWTLPCERRLLEYWRSNPLNLDLPAETPPSEQDDQLLIRLAANNDPPRESPQGWREDLGLPIMIDRVWCAPEGYPIGNNPYMSLGERERQERLNNRPKSAPPADFLGLPSKCQYLEYWCNNPLDINLPAGIPLSEQDPQPILNLAPTNDPPESPQQNLAPANDPPGESPHAMILGMLCGRDGPIGNQPFINLTELARLHRLKNPSPPPAESSDDEEPNTWEEDANAPFFPGDCDDL